MFATSLDLCSWQQDSNFSTSAVVNSSSFHYGVNNNTAEVSKGSPNYVQTLASKITFNGSVQQSLSVRPGQNFRLYVKPTDEFDLITFAVMRFTDVKDNARPQSFNPSSVTGSSIQRDPAAIDLIHVDPSLSPFFPSEGYVNLTFGLPNFPIEFVEPSIIRDTKVLIEMPFNTKNVEIAGFNLTVLPCQAGFVLKRQSNGLVQCDCSYGSHFWFGNQIISCNKDTEEIILMDGYWSISVKRERYHLENYPCPVPYCKCLKSGQDCFNYYNHSDTNGQCHPSRTGILCGSCVNNTGVGVLSLTCLENCRPYVGAISIVVLVLWNVILAILFLHLSHNFPPEFKGILFYIQIVPYATEYFPISVWQHKQYMLYFSNFLSFYFPVDFCLFPNVDTLTVYAIGYIPLIVIIATQLITIRIMVTFNQSRRFLRKSAVWNGLWMWILLVYSRYLYESTNLLNCFNIGNEGIRWFKDGTVKCFQTPGHVFLALLAIAVLIVGLAIIPLIFLLVYKKIKTRTATLHMYKPLTHGYKESAKWWAAVDLFRRFIIILVIVVLPGRTLIPAGVIFLIFLMHVYFQPYQTKWHNWLEMYILLHFVVMLLLRSTAALVEELTDYNGIMVPVTEHSRDSIAAWPQDDTATIFFLILIYFPLLLGMVYSLYCLIAYITLKIKRCFKKMSKTLKEKTTNTDSVVLHKYVKMKETTEGKPFTVSYA